MCTCVTLLSEGAARPVSQHDTLLHIDMHRHVYVCVCMYVYTCNASERRRFFAAAFPVSQHGTNKLMCTYTYMYVGV